MSYSAEVVKQDVQRDMLVLMRPKMRVTAWEIFSGTIYRTPFTFGFITQVKVNGTALTLGSSAAGLAVGQYFFDASYLYIRKASDRTPVWTNGIVIDANNNAIKFNEGAGTLTATIASGTYTTYSAFITAVVAAFNSAPGHANTYSLTTNSEFVDTDGRMRFSVSSTGTFTILGTNATFSAREVLGFSAVDITGSPQAFRITGDFVSVTYELYFSTREGYFNRDPLDSGSALKFWRGLIQGSPALARSSDNSVFGFIPIQSTSVSIANDAEYIQPILQESTFNQADCVIWHLVGNDQIKKIFTGITDAPTVGDQSISIPIFDKSYNLDRPVDNGDFDELFPDTQGTDATGADPAFALQPIRQIYGVAKGQRLVCTDAQINAPTTSENRKWVLMTEKHGVNYISSGVTPIDGITKEVTLASAKKLAHYYAMGFRKILIDGNLRNLTSVNVDTTRFTIDSVFLGGTFFQTLPFDTVFAQGNGVYLARAGTFYRLDINTHYTLGSVGPNGGFGIVLGAGVEAAHGISPNINPSTDLIFCDTLGYANIESVFSGDAGAYNPVVVLYWILTQVLGITNVDTATFQALALTSKSRCGLAIPATTIGSFPTIKDVINRLLTADFLQAFFNEEGNFTIRRIGPLGAADLSITDDELKDPSWAFSYLDISRVRVTNSGREFNMSIKKGGSTVTGPFVNNPNTQQMEVNFNHDANQYLHESGRETQIETAFATADYSGTISPTGITWTGKPTILNEANYAKRIAQVVGERFLRLSCVIKVGAHELDVGSTVQVTRKKLPGFIYDDSTQASKKFRIIEIVKEIGQVRVVMTDQKGIEDNLNDWS